MGQVFKSGAFIQQCFAVHPLCLNLKSLHLPSGLVLRCTSCNMLHRLTLRALVLRVSAVHAVEDETAAGDERAPQRIPPRSPSARWTWCGKPPGCAAASAGSCTSWM
jgi:hypothetical protein